MLDIVRRSINPEVKSVGEVWKSNFYWGELKRYLDNV